MGGVGVFVEEGSHYGGGGFDDADVGSVVRVLFGSLECPLDKARVFDKFFGATGGCRGALGGFTSFRGGVFGCVGFVGGCWRFF